MPLGGGGGNGPLNRGGWVLVKTVMALPLKKKNIGGLPIFTLEISSPSCPNSVWYPIIIQFDADLRLKHFIAMIILYSVNMASMNQDNF